MTVYRRRNSRLFWTILERISRMQQPHAIDVLNIAFLEIQPKRIFLRQEMHCVQGFRLSLSNRRNILTPFLLPVSCEVPA
jgi:hypothetical protein